MATDEIICCRSNLARVPPVRWRWARPRRRRAGAIRRGVSPVEGNEPEVLGSANLHKSSGSKELQMAVIESRQARTSVSAERVPHWPLCTDRVQLRRHDVPGPSLILHTLDGACAYSLLDDLCILIAVELSLSSLQKCTTGEMLSRPQVVEFNIRRRSEAKPTRPMIASLGP